ncbi:MAG: ankyrin repeat domain-containing protein [Verrucomicrobia bacterium]|nr:ankyrin repeat domain-containing protein [Verrucomicrobiota bacterium]
MRKPEKSPEAFSPKRVLLMALGGLLIVPLVGWLWMSPQTRKDTRLVLHVSLFNFTHEKKNLRAIRGAIRNGDVATVKKLVENNPELVNAYDGSPAQTPLHTAASHGHLQIVELLLAKGAQVNAKDEYGATSLHNAARSRHKDIVELLLSKGAEVNKGDFFNHTPLYRAAENGNQNVVKLLLQKGANVHVRDSEDGTTALPLAIRGNHERIVHMLLARGADVNVADHDGLTPLHWAAQRGNTRIATLLITKGAAVNAKTEAGVNPLHLAALAESTNMVEFLLSNKAEPDIFVASGLGKADRVAQLLKSAPHLALVRDTNTWTALHWAAESSQTNTAELLLAHGAEVNARTQWLNGPSGTYPKEGGDVPLHFATKHEHTNMVAWLLAKGANVNAVGLKNETPLHVAVKNGHLDIVEQLLAKGAKLNLRNDDDCTPLALAVEGGRKKITKLLLSRKADVHETDLYGATLLHRTGDKEIMKLLLAMDTEIKKADIHTKNKSGRTPLDLAAVKGDTEIMELLLAKGAKLTFFAASALGRVNDMALFLQADPALVNVRDDQGRTPLHYAAQTGQTKAAQWLLDRGADVNAKLYWWGHTSSGKPVPRHHTPLHLAAKKGHIDLVKLLLARGADGNAKDGLGVTPLHLAIQKGHIEMVKCILAYKANVNVRWEPSSFGHYMANPRKRPQSIRPYLKSGKRYGFTGTPLDYAVILENKPLVELLLARGADVNDGLGHNPTALHKAAGRGDRDIVELLLAKGAEANAKLYQSHLTPLHIAASDGCQQVVEVLLSHGADVHAKDWLGETPLDYAVTQDHPDIADLLRQHGGRE